MTTSPKNWIAKKAFKKLAADLRTSEGRSFERAALPYFRLVFGDVRQAIPALDHRGIDLVKGEEAPFALVVQCKSSVERISLPQQLTEARKSIRSFRESGRRAGRYIFLFNREEETVEHRAALLADCRELEQLGIASTAEIWSHHDLLNAAFNAMQKRVEEWITTLNVRFREEQCAVEAIIGSEPLCDVPFDEYEMRIDAARLREVTAVRRTTGDPLQRLTGKRRRRIRLLLGRAGMGKTTTIARVTIGSDRRWLVIRASRIRGDVASAHVLFEAALDDDIIADAGDADRPAWQAIVGPVLKYLTQFDSNIGIIVDALDEAPGLQTSFGLQRFFNLFRRTVLPVVITMRSDFWYQRQSDFDTELEPTPRETTVQTLEVIELADWSDTLIADAARGQLAHTDDAASQQRLRKFISRVGTDDFKEEYGDVPRTPLFLRIILDLVISEQATRLSRVELVRRWARLKVLRDVMAPARTGGARISIASGVHDADETVRRSFAAMRTAAKCMTYVAEGELRLRSECTFEEIERVMGALAPKSALALTLNSLLVPTGFPADDGAVSLRFAHRLFQEFFLAAELAASGITCTLRMPDAVREWLVQLADRDVSVTPGAH